MFYISIVLISFLLYGNALDGHWRWDDTQALRQIFQYGSIASFIDADVYNQYSIINLFPWLLLSKEIDLLLFGPEPFWFYLHQHLSITIAGIFLFAVGRQWMETRFAFVATVLFLCGPPLAYASEQFMTRHYVEGLIFALISLYAFTRCVENFSRRNWVVSIFFYTLAVTCKEVYVPLVLLFPFIPRGSIRVRIRLVIPIIAIAFLYVFWRMYMLVSLFGGYAESLQIDFQFLLAIADSFLNIPSLLFPDFYWLAILLCLAVLLSGIVIGKANSVLFLYVAALVLTPLAPLVVSSGLTAPDRYFIVPLAGLSFVIPYFVTRFLDASRKIKKTSRVSAIAVLLILVFISLYNGRQYLWRDIMPWAREFDIVAEFLHRLEGE